MAKAIEFLKELMGEVDPRKAVVLAASVVVGNLIYALGIALFVVPGGLVTGGTTGIGLALQHAFGVPLAPFVAIFNLAMFALGFIALGKVFALSTLASTVAYPVLLGAVQAVAGDFVLTCDPLLCALFGGLCIGVGLAMVLRLGASTGGMDIPPLVINKRFGLPISVTMYAFDFAILLVQVPFTDLNGLLYGIVLVMVYTVALDKLLAAGERHVQLEVVTLKGEEVGNALLSSTGWKVTVIQNTIVCDGVEAWMVRCILHPRDLRGVESTVRTVDHDALIVESRVGAVRDWSFGR